MAILEGLISGDPELMEIFGEERVKKFQKSWKEWDSKIDNVKLDEPLCKYMTQEELEEYIGLICPQPIF